METPNTPTKRKRYAKVITEPFPAISAQPSLNIENPFEDSYNKMVSSLLNFLPEAQKIGWDITTREFGTITLSDFLMKVVSGQVVTYYDPVISSIKSGISDLDAISNVFMRDNEYYKEKDLQAVVNLAIETKVFTKDGKYPITSPLLNFVNLENALAFKEFSDQLEATYPGILAILPANPITCNIAEITSAVSKIINKK